MYIHPQPHKCINCGHEFEFSVHSNHSAPVSSDGVPTCPKCWDAFLKTLGQGFHTTRWVGPKSDYELALDEKMKQIQKLTFIAQ